MLGRMDDIGGRTFDPDEGSDRSSSSFGDPACPTGMLERDDEPIWCRIELAEVAAIVDEYELWKDDAWYHEVDWAAVSDVLDRLIQANAVDGVVTDLVPLVSDALGDLQTVDAEGLVALMGEPITVTRAQLTNGGHRLKAMLRQGVITVPGMFVRSDAGNSVSAGRVYPLSAEADATT